MPERVTPGIRSLVARRANHRCEYCLMLEDDAFFGCEVDHIVSLKHGGPSKPGNLALACSICNRRKGSDIGSIHWKTNEFVRFFNPRTDRWSDHFVLSGPLIHALSPIGEVTVRILGFNEEERVLEREALMEKERYFGQI